MVRIFYKWLVIIKPINYSCVLFLVQFQLDGFQGLNIQYIITVIDRRLFIVKRRKSHTLKMTTITFFATHSQPHRSPLSMIYGLDNPRYFINKGDGTCNVVQDGHLTHLFPWHRYIFQQFQHGMWDIFKCTQMYTLFSAVFAVAHVTMILHNFANVLRRKLLFTRINECCLASSFSILATLSLLPFTRFDS